jgi:TetR/AcrR family transcriptional regulator, cholesterol catabolism regulator
MEQHIKDIAFARFKLLGFRNVTMDYLANQLGISKKTIYQYFKDKDALVDAIVIDEISRNKQQCEDDKKKASDAIEENVLALHSMREIFSDINPSFLFDLQKFHHHSFLKFEHFKNNFLFELIHSNLERGIQEGNYRSDINTEIITTVRLESIMLVFTNPHFVTNKYSVIQIEEQILHHYLHGIVSEKGLKLLKKYLSKSENSIVL